MSTIVSSNVQLDATSAFEVTGYTGSGCEPFVSVRSCDDRGLSVMSLILRDHGAIRALRAALDEADTALTTARVKAALARAAS